MTRTHRQHKRLETLRKRRALYKKVGRLNRDFGEWRRAFTAPSNGWSGWLAARRREALAHGYIAIRALDIHPVRKLRPHMQARI